MWDVIKTVVAMILEAVIGLLVEKANEPSVAVSAGRDPSRKRRLERIVRAHKDRLDSRRSAGATGGDG